MKDVTIKMHPALKEVLDICNDVGDWGAVSLSGFTVLAAIKASYEDGERDAERKAANNAEDMMSKRMARVRSRKFLVECRIEGLWRELLMHTTYIVDKATDLRAKVAEEMKREHVPIPPMMDANMLRSCNDSYKEKAMMIDAAQDELRALNVILEEHEKGQCDGG